MSGNPLNNKRCFRSFIMNKLEYIELKGTELTYECMLLWLCRNFKALSCMKEIDISDCKTIDEFKDGEGLDLKTLLLTVMPNLEMVNGEVLTAEDGKAARNLMTSSSVN